MSFVGFWFVLASLVFLGGTTFVWWQVKDNRDPHLWGFEALVIAVTLLFLLFGNLTISDRDNAKQYRAELTDRYNITVLAGNPRSATVKFQFNNRSCEADTKSTAGIDVIILKSVVCTNTKTNLQKELQKAISK